MSLKMIYESESQENSSGVQDRAVNVQSLVQAAFATGEPSASVVLRRASSVVTPTTKQNAKYLARQASLCTI